MASNIALAQPREAQWLDATEVASLIRGDLRRTFPGVKFSVTSQKYAGGSSVRVNWTDGPLTKQVDAVLARYCAQGFDGMTDSTTNSGPVRLDDGRLVRISSYINTSRRYSDALRARVDGWLTRHAGDAVSDYDADTRRWQVLHRATVTPAGHLAVVHEGAVR